jgi:hypothetical protein
LDTTISLKYFFRYWSVLAESGNAGQSPTDAPYATASSQLYGTAPFLGQSLEHDLEEPVIGHGRRDYLLTRLVARMSFENLIACERFGNTRS